MTSHFSAAARRLFALYAKEINAYFSNPAAYIAAVVFLLITGYFFGQSLFLYNQADLRPFLDLAPLLLVFFMPAVTMRSLAEEAKVGTLENLMTLPVEEWEILATKFMAALTLLAFTLFLTLAYPISLACLGQTDPGAILGAYWGLFCSGMLLAGAGIFASALTRNQIVAFITAFLISFLFYALGQVSRFLPLWLASIADYLSFTSHLDTLSRGILDSRDMAYYLTGTAVFLLLAQARLRSTHAD